jgi:hypothetical protein
MPTTTIFTARDYDPHKEHRRRQRIIVVVCIVVILASLAYVFRHWPDEHEVNHFFTLIEHQDYKGAYALWQNDPAWEQHPAKYPNYPFDDFMRDWGPASEWGAITSHQLVGSAAKGSGVIVAVRINGRLEPARLWVEKKDKTLTFSPY